MNKNSLNPGNKLFPRFPFLFTLRKIILLLSSGSFDTFAWQSTEGTSLLGMIKSHVAVHTVTISSEFMIRDQTEGKNKKKKYIQHKSYPFLRMIRNKRMVVELISFKTFSVYRSDISKCKKYIRGIQYTVINYWMKEKKPLVFL